MFKDNLFLSFFLSFLARVGRVCQSRWAEVKAVLQNITYIHSEVGTLGVLQSCNVALKDENLAQERRKSFQHSISKSWIPLHSSDSKVFWGISFEHFT